MPKIKVKLDLKQDAWNWWDACNKVSHGVDWKMKVDRTLREKIVGKNQSEAELFLIPYLKKFYTNKDIKSYVKKMGDEFYSAEEKIFKRMEKVSSRPIYRNDFTCFITSFPRFPYKYDMGYVWISNKRSIDYQISTFIHELLHFQYFAYFGEYVWNELGSQKHAELKEAMTVIINDEFKDITSEKDEGYEIHQLLRKKLIKIWREVKDMDKFIERAVCLLRK